MTTIPVTARMSTRILGAGAVVLMLLSVVFTFLVISGQTAIVLTRTVVVAALLANATTILLARIRHEA